MQEKEFLQLIEKMKTELLHDVSEWLGSELPDAGTEDYETWQEWLKEIDEIRSFGDIYEYLDARGRNIDEFFESWEVKFDVESGNFQFLASD
jgi:hypothetical protein